jgi:hypothetical protein
VGHHARLVTPAADEHWRVELYLGWRSAYIRTLLAWRRLDGFEAKAWWAMFLTTCLLAVAGVLRFLIF